MWVMVEAYQFEQLMTSVPSDCSRPLSKLGAPTPLMSSALSMPVQQSEMYGPNDFPSTLGFAAIT